MSLPYGWSDQYALNELYRVSEDLKKRVSDLEREVARLEKEKAGRRGRKPTVER